jgi:hypothetical protein
MGLCVFWLILTAQSEKRGQFFKTFDADLGLTKNHLAAICFVEHPVRQFPSEAGALRGIDALQVFAAPEVRYLNCLIKQRMPRVRNP